MFPLPNHIMYIYNLLHIISTLSGSLSIGTETNLLSNFFKVVTSQTLSSDLTFLGIISVLRFYHL